MSSSQVFGLPRESSRFSVKSVIAHIRRRHAALRAEIHGQSASFDDTYDSVRMHPRLRGHELHQLQDTVNRGLKHLPMEHDLSVEAFHPETVSDVSPLEHLFSRAPHPTLHVCYHGVRAQDTEFHPAVRRAEVCDRDAEGRLDAGTEGSGETGGPSTVDGGDANGH